MFRIAVASGTFAAHSVLISAMAIVTKYFNKSYPIYSIPIKFPNFHLILKVRPSYLVHPMVDGDQVGIDAFALLSTHIDYSELDM